jgi:hypothetical protein
MAPDLVDHREAAGLDPVDPGAGDRRDQVAPVFGRDQ